MPYFRQQECDGIVEDVPPNDVGRPENTYHMPHHAVVRPDRLTTKVRVVFDCSSKESSQHESIASLNECLVTGTCKFADLFSVLIRFRIYNIGLSADIEKAFHQIGVKEEDRDLTRFVWVHDTLNLKMNTKARKMRFCRVAFGIVSSMAILDHVNQHHLQLFEETYPETVNVIRNSLYIDDCNGGVTNVAEGFRFYKEMKKIYSEAGMNVRKWITNDPVFQAMFKEEDYDN